MLKDLISLFFPEQCACCHRHLKKNESLICTFCRHDLPCGQYTNIPFNAIEKRFFGRVPLCATTALFRFQENGKIQKLIHALKYQNKPLIGIFAANLMGQEILNSDRFPPIDIIIPVPLHPKKQRKRGYNQNTLFGQKLAEILSAEFCNTILLKKNSNRTQTRQSRRDRWQNVQNSFYLKNPKKLTKKHILLIDDVITTGATLEACYKQLLKAEIKISIASMAYTETI